jgi:hypothetical protein
MRLSMRRWRSERSKLEGKTSRVHRQPIEIAHALGSLTKLTHYSMIGSVSE